MTTLKRMTEAGMLAFRKELHRIRDGHEPDFGLFLDEEGPYCESVPVALPQNPPRLATKRELATFVIRHLGLTEGSEVFQDGGIWSWLSVYLYDSIASHTGGKVPVRADAHYIPELDNSKRIYRHLVRTACVLALSMPRDNRLVMELSAGQHGDIIEQFASRLYIMRIPAVADAIDRLYYDEQQGRPKRGITTKSPRGGDLRNRFPSRIKQLQKTYDLYSLNAGELVDLMGPEFGEWLQR